MMITIITMNEDKLMIFLPGLAMMLLCVVLVFFLCNILALVVNVLEVILSSTLFVSILYQYQYCINIFALVVNVLEVIDDCIFDSFYVNIVTDMNDS